MCGVTGAVARGRRSAFPTRGEAALEPATPASAHSAIAIPSATVSRRALKPRRDPILVSSVSDRNGRTRGEAAAGPAQERAPSTPLVVPSKPRLRLEDPTGT